MKKAILLGDSIRQIGYGKRVAEMLSDEYEVWQPEENCRFAQYTLRGMWDWAPAFGDGVDVVHWNNGHWDYCTLYGDGPFTPLDVYVDTMVRIAKILKSRSKRVIFATTTPVLDSATNNNADVMKYNEAVVPKLQELGVEINDLFGLCYPKKEEFIRSDDRIHLTDAGIDACSNQIVSVIRGK